MNEDRVKILIEEGKLKQRIINKPLIQSLISSAEENAKATLTIQVSELMATLIFKGIYDSIRQLGEVKWRLNGYEPEGHNISIESLIEENIHFRQLDLFRKLRNDANYRGYRISIGQANEIISFWKRHGSILLLRLKKENET